MRITHSFIGLVLIGCIVLASCKDKGTQPTTTSGTDSTAQDTTVNAVSPEEPDSTVLIRLTQEILNLSAQAKYSEIAAYIHPVDGIRFSPYTYVDTKEHHHFTQQEFREQTEQHAKEKIVWGTYDPEGSSIKLTVAEYFREFAHNKDYVGGQHAYNQTIGGGTTINNIAEAYPGAPFVEAYWAPADEEKAPFEWGSARLVFRKHEGKFYLIAWVNDAWST